MQVTPVLHVIHKVLQTLVRQEPLKQEIPLTMVRQGHLKQEVLPILVHQILPTVIEQILVLQVI